MASLKKVGNFHDYEFQNIIKTFKFRKYGKVYYQ